MSQFALLHRKILLSSIWINGTKDEKLLWFTILALKDQEGRVLCSFPGLADAAKLTRDECRVALDALMAPDPDDTSGVAEGRRVLVIQGGWQVVNHELYRFSDQAKREKWRLAQAEYRKKRGKSKPPNGNPVGEDAYVRAAGAGASDAQLDRIVTESLPPDPEPPQVLNP